MVLKMLVFGDPEEEDPQAAAEEGKNRTPTPPSPATQEMSTVQYSLRLLMCVAGLQVSYLTWGVLQVRLVVVGELIPIYYCKN